MAWLGAAMMQVIALLLTTATQKASAISITCPSQADLTFGTDMGMSAQHSRSARVGTRTVMVPVHPSLPYKRCLQSKTARGQTSAVRSNACSKRLVQLCAVRSCAQPFHTRTRRALQGGAVGQPGS